MAHWFQERFDIADAAGIQPDTLEYPAVMWQLLKANLDRDLAFHVEDQLEDEDTLARQKADLRRKTFVNIKTNIAAMTSDTSESQDFTVTKMQYLWITIATEWFEVQTVPYNDNWRERHEIKVYVDIIHAAVTIKTILSNKQYFENAYNHDYKDGQRVNFIKKSTNKSSCEQNFTILPPYTSSVINHDDNGRPIKVEVNDEKKGVSATLLFDGADSYLSTVYGIDNLSRILCDSRHTQCSSQHESVLCGY